MCFWPVREWEQGQEKMEVYDLKVYLKLFAC